MNPLTRIWIQRRSPRSVLIEPHGRIHFVGACADNLNWGMEAETRSANRVAEASIAPDQLETSSSVSPRSSIGSDSSVTRQNIAR